MPDITRLKRLWLVSMLIGVGAFAAALGWVYANTDFDWIWSVAALGVGAIAQSAAFYLLCLWRAPALGGFITGEETKVEGDNVVTETAHAETGDPALDRYIRAYVNARGATMVAASTAVMIVIALAIYVVSG